MQSSDIDPRACHHCSLRDREKVSECEEEGAVSEEREDWKKYVKEWRKLGKEFVSNKGGDMERKRHQERKVRITH